MTVNGNGKVRRASGRNRGTGCSFLIQIRDVIRIRNRDLEEHGEKPWQVGS